MADSIQDHSRPIEALSFVSGKNFWNPERTNDYEHGSKLGCQYAEEMLSFINDGDNAPAIFGSVMRSMTAGGIYSPVEMGFCNRIGIELLGLPMSYHVPVSAQEIATQGALS